MTNKREPRDIEPAVNGHIKAVRILNQGNHVREDAENRTSGLEGRHTFGSARASQLDEQKTAKTPKDARNEEILEMNTRWSSKKEDFGRFLANTLAIQIER